MKRAATACLLTLATVLIPVPAEAKGKGGIPFLFGAGEHIHTVIDNPARQTYSGFNTYTDIGYLYNGVTIFFIPVITWGPGEFVLCDANDWSGRYIKLSSYDVANIERKHGPLKPQIGTWLRFVRWLFTVLE